MTVEPVISRECPPVPLVGVGALIVRDGAIVLVRRGKPPAMGEWSIPGGLVHLGETLADAVIRESKEETGLEVEPVMLVEVLERIFHDQIGRIQYHYVLADYLCRVRGGVLQHGSDVTDAVWAERPRLSDYGLAQVTRKVVDKAFDKLSAGLTTPT
ncbi:MAG: NUDIX hydrolase [Pseudomonadota bacterium]